MTNRHVVNKSFTCLMSWVNPKVFILLHFQLTTVVFSVAEWSTALSHVDTKYKCGFESHYPLNNFNVLFLLNLKVTFNISKVNYYFDIYFL